MNSSYESAPATLMLATFCACCGRPLVDAKSVQTGMGPSCRSKHGLNITVAAGGYPISEEARTAANRLVHEIAVDQTGPRVLENIQALKALGFDVLAGRIEERLLTVDITVEGGSLVVRAPFNETFLQGSFGLKGRYFDRARKVTIVAASAKPQLWTLLQRAYPGLTGRGPKGLFQIGGAS